MMYQDPRVTIKQREMARQALGHDQLDELLLEKRFNQEGLAQEETAELVPDSEQDDLLQNEFEEVEG